MDIRPLTKRSSNGALYQRREPIIQQIASVPALTDPSLLQRAARGQSAPDALAAEALVYFTREAVRAAHYDLVDQLAVLLLGRCQATIRDILRRMGVNAGELEEAAQDVVETLFRQITDVTTGQWDYLEIGFFDVVTKLCTKTAAPYLRRQRHEDAAVRLDGGGAEDDDGAPLTPQVASNGTWSASLSAEDLALAQAALATLEPHIREAFILYHYHEFPIESQDGSATTISAIFHVTPRTIRNWLSRAEERLTRWRGEE